MKSRSEAQLEEALLGAEALYAITKELKKRSKYDN
jgi:hypothetical protein